jgi:arylsulfatase A
MFQRLVFCLAAAFALTAFHVGAADAKRPNVVFILIDDMGFADLSSYGATDVKTPNIDRIGTEGVRLTNCYSNGPVCTPTRCGFITGRYQQRVGLEWAIYPGQKDPGLMTTEPSIGRMLKQKGYATAIFGKWHLGYLPEFSPNAHGFDEYMGLLSGNVDHYSHKEINDEHDWYENTVNTVEPGYSTDLITARAVQFVDAHAENPFFLYVPYNAVHWPFNPPDKPESVRTRKTWFSGTRKDDYIPMLEHVDKGVGQILAALERHNLTRDTLVIFTDDNGGERLSNMGPLAKSKGTLWEGGVHVPGLVRWPARIPAGRVVDTPVITMDFTATIAKIVGAEPVKPFDGLDLFPLLDGSGTLPERALCWRIQRDKRDEKSIRRGKWKLLIEKDKEYLFDLENDLGEKNNLIADKPEIAARLKKELLAWDDEMNHANPPFVVK